ncbi:sugar-phosphatase [Tersicoccus solisilvae]|uniref:Sugar-phosphatase n=1 Tax=Tersicoccus solisilvae TaxID=1882339 RepID=A0ABQ1NRX0_9MICC|nr:HAD-IIA family hydrolase [Tersicoccus solisilvae]GGC83987.1 sugar-phosphatase [Tersicoccus solisilvae]
MSGDRSGRLIDRFDGLLCDLDGVVYAGPNAIPHAVESLNRIAEAGIAVGYVTNNASRSPADVAAHLTDLGAPASERTVVTSAQAGARLLAEKLTPGDAVLITGSDYLAAEVRRVGLTPVTSATDDPQAVIQGFDPSIGWVDLAEAAYAINAGALWVATNTDATIPRDRGIAPGNGTLVAAVRAAVDVDPLVAGKPEAPLFQAAAAELDISAPLVIGDRLDTDILGGNNAGLTSALVLTGVDTVHTTIAAVPGQRPDLLLADLRELFAPVSEAAPDGDGFRCGESSARVDGDTVLVDGREDDLDGWRAACAAWWAAHPDDAATPHVSFG